MKVLHIITGLDQGGAEATLVRLISASNSSVVNIVISLRDGGVYQKVLHDIGCKVYTLGMLRGWLSLAGLRRLGSIICEVRPDVVQTWMYHSDFIGGFLSRIFGIPVVWGVRHSNLDRRANKRTTIWVARACAWFSGWIPHAIVSCSARAVNVHQTFGYRCRFVVIPNGIDLMHYCPDAHAREMVRAELRVEASVLLVGHIGRFHPQKDHSNFLKAAGFVAKQIPGARFVMCGRGVDLNNQTLVALARDLGVADRLLLLGERGDVPALMNAFDLFVLSSLGEAFPNVVAEAMACGIPCVVTDVGDAAEIVGDTGWVVPSREPLELANGIMAALSKSEADRKSLGRLAKQRVEERFTLERMTSAFREVWAGAIKGKQ